MRIRITLSLTKRQKIVIASILVTLGLMIVQTISIFFRTQAILGLTLFTFLISFWALHPGMNWSKAFTLLTLPTLFTFGVANFYFLLPPYWVTRLPIDIAFGIALYFILLSQNIFNVAASRTIPLHRVSSAATFLATIFTAFLLAHILYSIYSLYAFSSPVLLNGVLVMVFSFLLILPVLWSIDMEGIQLPISVFSLVLALLMGELAVVLSFWPIPPYSFMRAIMLSSFMFIVLGMTVDYFRNRLNRGEIALYTLFGVLVFLVTYLTTSWNG